MFFFLYGLLTFPVKYAKILLGTAVTTHGPTTAGGLATPPERGCQYAYHFDLSREAIHYYGHCEKQKPPLWQVTVSNT